MWPSFTTRLLVWQYSPRKDTEGGLRQRYLSQQILKVYNYMANKARYPRHQKRHPLPWSRHRDKSLTKTQTDNGKLTRHNLECRIIQRKQRWNCIKSKATVHQILLTLELERSPIKRSLAWIQICEKRNEKSVKKQLTKKSILMYHERIPASWSWRYFWKKVVAQYTFCQLL